MARLIRAGNRQLGFSYLIAIFLVAVTSVLALVAVQRASMADQREREAELLFRGEAIRLAITQYYIGSPGQSKQYPHALSDLLEDGRPTHKIRYLRQIYVDPMTGTTDWGLIKDANDNVMGVYSKSTRTPIKVDGFQPGEESFRAATQYQGWRFVYPPQ